MDPQSQAPQESQQLPVQPQVADTVPTSSLESMANPQATAVEAAPATVPTVAGTVNTHLVLSIVSLVLGGALFAVIAIIFSVMANSALKAGNIPEAESKAKWAKVLAVIGMVLGVLFWLMLIALMATGGLNLEGEGSFSAS